MTQSDIINNNFSKAFECIKCSNAYDTGEVLSEEKLFKQISERKHSNFDKSKFAVVGSPTITDDGVASGFSTANTIRTPEILWGNSFKVSIRFNLSSLPYYACLIGGVATDKNSICLTVNSDMSVVLNVSDDGSMNYTVVNNLRSPAGAISLNHWYDVDVLFDGFSYKIYVNGNLLAEKTTNKLPYNSLLQLGSEMTDTNYGMVHGSIDLKHFSITVDGKEVFSGNKTGIDVINDIEIPYTLSKTGSKIVDVAYRDRVINLYEQQGHARYYTIDEDNKNFTLPMGEIYGMIGGSSSTGGSGLELCDIGMSLYIDETKGLRRYLNGQIVDINTNTQAFLNRLKEITTLHPSLLDTEENWQAAKTLSPFGQVGKFVFNYSGEDIVSVRIPAIVNVQGLFDLQNLGMTVGAGLPTHTHTRGTMEISGNIYTIDGGGGGTGADGAFAVTGQWAQHGRGKDNSTHSNVNFNASRSWTGSTSAPNNSIYGASNTVQPEAIQYPYFIQIATGSETENNIVNEIELNNPYSLFDSKYSDHELNNLSWLKSEGQWNAKAVYTDAYDELLREYNDSTSVEETEGSITFKRTPKGYKIALANQETAIDTKYSTDGIAWYYILDTTNEKFKLPRTKFGFEGLRTSVGDDITESLPNIKGSIGGLCANGASGTGAFSNAYGVSNMGFGGNVVTTYGTNFDASRSSSTYQDNAPVQERGTQMYLYFYVGETVQNANLIDAGRIGEQLANKIGRTECKAYITETYVNGTSGYRIWSDGYCEQWGRVSATSQTVTFLKAFANTSYCITGGLIPGNTTATYEHLNIGSLTTTSFYYACYDGYQLMWKAGGYIA